MAGDFELRGVDIAVFAPAFAQQVLFSASTGKRGDFLKIVERLRWFPLMTGMVRLLPFVIALMWSFCSALPRALCYLMRGALRMNNTFAISLAMSFGTGEL